MQATQHPPWLSPELPSREASVVTALLERRAQEIPQATCIRFDNDLSWTYADTWEYARQTAAFLQGRGVTRGDNVLAWLPNGPELIRTWFACNYLGAVFVPLNTEYRGRLLSHAIATAAARVMLVHPQLADRLTDADRAGIEHLVVTGDAAAGDGGAGLAGPTADLGPPAAMERWDLQMIIFTSGTTGPSKGVMCSYLQTYTTARANYGYINASDRILVDLPLCHVGGVTPIIAAITEGASVALYQSFRTSEFWRRIEESGATTSAGLIGSMAAFLSTTAPAPMDADNSVHTLVVGPLDQRAMDLARRFDFAYISGFNMTEASTPLLTEVNSTALGSCGRPRTGVECDVVDEHDIPCPAGVPGELVIRTSVPWQMFLGYFNNPEATAAAWRNGWFHTGDVVCRDENGDYFFVDRKKDAIRRRGENISSLEIESEAYAHPAVAEAAALGVPSEHGEEEVLLAVVAKPGTGILPAELVEFLVPRMPRYMVPRYVRVMEQLPKTPTNKIKKVALREEGVTADCWDRESAGLTLSRTRLSD